MFDVSSDGSRYLISFGLRMLDALSSRWGVDNDESGTRVWFEVDRRRRRFQRS